MQKQRVELRPIELSSVALIVLCCMAWGMNQVSVKIAMTSMPPLGQAGLRSFVSMLLLLAWCRYRKIRLMARDGSMWPGLAVGMTFAVNFMLMYLGLALTTASRGTLFTYAMPFLVALGAHVLIPGDRLSWTKSAGLVLSFAGLALALSEGLMSGGSGNLTGDLLCFAAAFTWAGSTLIMRATRLQTVAAEKVLFYQLAVSAPVLAVAAFLKGESPPSFADPVAVAAFLYTAGIVAFASYVLWVWLLSRHPASQVTVFSFLAPIFGAAAGHIVFGDPLTVRFLAALTLVGVGIWLVNRPRKT